MSETTGGTNVFLQIKRILCDMRETKDFEAPKKMKTIKKRNLRKRKRAEDFVNQKRKSLFNRNVEGRKTL